MTVLVQCLHPENNQSSSSFFFFFFKVHLRICVVLLWSWPLFHVRRFDASGIHATSQFLFACFVFAGSFPVGGVRSWTPRFGGRLGWAAAISLFMQTGRDPLGAPGWWLMMGGEVVIPQQTLPVGFQARHSIVYMFCVIIKFMCIKQAVSVKLYIL